MTYVVEREQTIARPLAEVFAFFSDAANLARLTPASLHFEILTPLPIEMRAGTIIDYRLRLFVDVQLEGPYRSWRHVHEFEEAPGGTLVKDRVAYEMPFGKMGAIARALFVGRQLEGVFDFRRVAIDAIFRES